MNEQICHVVTNAETSAAPPDISGLHSGPLNSMGWNAVGKLLVKQEKKKNSDTKHEPSPSDVPLIFVTNESNSGYS